MFHNPNVFFAMANSEYKFYLTGSRFFGTQQQNSDWDFFVQKTISIDNDLSGMGFKREEKPSYIDPICDTVWKHPDGIHVQVVDDGRLKETAQLIIQNNNLLRFALSKTESALVWKAVITTLVEERDGLKKESESW